MGAGARAGTGAGARRAGRRRRRRGGSASAGFFGAGGGVAERALTIPSPFSSLPRVSCQYCQ